VSFGVWTLELFVWTMLVNYVCVCGLWTLDFGVVVDCDIYLYYIYICVIYICVIYICDVYLVCFDGSLKTKKLNFFTSLPSVMHLAKLGI
jgi:hypothetical protein